MAGIQLGLIGSFYGAVGDFESIATVSVGAGGTATITFSSIPSTYTHLQIRAIHKDELAGTGRSWCTIALNSDTTTTNYAAHSLSGDGASAAASGYDSASGSGRYSFLNPHKDNAGGSGAYGVLVMDILDYANTNKYKTVRTLNGWDGNGSGDVALSSNLWMNTAAVTTVAISNSTGGGDQAEYSHFALYGIKG